MEGSHGSAAEILTPATQQQPSLSLTVTEIPSFAHLYEEHFDFVWRSSRRLGVPESMIDDAVQEVFVIVYRRLAEFEGRSSLKTWLFGIVRNVTREVRRSIRRKSPHDAHHGAALADPDLLVASAEEQPDRVAERSAENRVLYDILSKLDDEKREVFILAELEQFSMPQIAEAVGCKLNTAYSRLRLAREVFADAAARYRAANQRADNR